MNFRPRVFMPKVISPVLGKAIKMAVTENKINLIHLAVIDGLAANSHFTFFPFS